MKNKEVLFRHRLLNKILKPVAYLYVKLLFHLKVHDKMKIKKDENVIVLSNHQTDFDPIFLSFSFNKPIYFMATDTINNDSFVSKFLRYAFNFIPKKKGISDPLAIKKMMRINKENGSIAIFPEGNRSYAEFQFYIEDSIPKLIKSLKSTLVLFNIDGGFGCFPRFAKKRRKGKIETRIVKIMKYDEYNKLDDDTLLKIIKDNLLVFDSNKEKRYKSKHQAEYLESMFFICPCCHKLNTLYSKNEYIYCSNCNSKTRYNENLTLSSDTNKFTSLVKWYDFQRRFIKDNDISPFIDENVSLFEYDNHNNKKLIKEGTLTLDKEYLSLADIKIPLIDIISSATIQGNKFTIITNDHYYLFKGINGFNALKYVLMFNKLETTQKIKKLDKYYRLED